MPFAQEKVDRAIEILREQGHEIVVQKRERLDGSWRSMYEIDRHLLVTRDDMIGIADGVHTFTQLEEDYRLHPER
jgi:hypothetical protein